MQGVILPPESWGLLMTTKKQTVYKTWEGRKYALIPTQGTPISDTITRVIATYERNRTGVPNPNWRKNIQDDVNAGTNFSANEQTFESVPFSGVIHTTPPAPGSKEQRYEHYGQFSGWNLPGKFGSAVSAASTIEADRIALRNLHRKIKEVNHQFQGGTFAAQLGKAIRMVLSPAKTLRTSMAKYFTDVKKRTRGVKQPKVRKVIADTYLEYTFGWQPLLLDTKEAAIALARFSEERYQKSRFKVFGKDEKLSSQHSFISAFNAYGTQYPFYYLIDTRTIGRAAVYYYGLFRGGVQNLDGTESQAGRLAALCGFDLQSFLPTIWECIPYSFVVDYFSNVGDVVDAYSHSTAVVRWINKVQILSVEKTDIFFPDINLTKQQTWLANFPRHVNIYVDGQRALSKAVYRSMTRTRLEEVPFPTLHFKIPSIGSMKWINLGALALGAKSMNP